jgi:molybdate transport system substrate-binding protein
MKRNVFGVAAVVGTLLFVASPNAGAQLQGGAIRVLISNGLKTSIEALRPDAESAVGRPLAMEFSSTAALKKRIQSGEHFDATLITAEAIRDLIKEGKLAATPHANLGFSPLVVGIRAGAPKPDLGTIDGLKRTLLSAKSITYPHDGATRGYLEQMFDRLGIASQVTPKIILAEAPGSAAESVASGRVELVLQLFSEIAPVHGLEVAGPLPGDLRHQVNFAGAASATAANSVAVKALLEFLSGPRAAAVFTANGVTR